MYHAISDDAEPGESPYYRVCTSPRRFAEQMQWLATNSWQGVTLTDGLAFLTGRKTFNRRPVAITFDDGFRDFHTGAAPTLQRHSFAATMYLTTGYVGEARRRFKGRECLIWSEVAELHTAGFEFGSHTVNHPKLVECTWPVIERELRDSKAEIENQLQSSVASFAYPFAFPLGNRSFVKRFCETVAASGYHSNATTTIGRVRPGDDPYRVRRLPMNDCDDPQLLSAKLAGAYDWMSWPQYAKKALLLNR